MRFTSALLLCVASLAIANPLPASEVEKRGDKDNCNLGNYAKVTQARVADECVPRHYRHVNIAALTKISASRSSSRWVTL